MDNNIDNNLNRDEQNKINLDSSKKMEQKSNLKCLKNKKTKDLIALTIIVSVLFGGLFGFIGGQVANQELLKSIKNKDIISGDEQSGAEEGSKKAPNEEASLADLKTEESAVMKVVEQSSHSVVSIIVTKDVPKLNSFFEEQFFSDPFFNPFGMPDSRQKESNEPNIEKKEIGGGTGFLVSEDGYIMTNRHVVKDSQAEYTVVMNNGDKIKADVIARDTLMDLAVLKINTDKKLVAVKLGDSDKIRVGQTVVAIGNSLGEFRNTVSKGIISGLKRDVKAGDRLTGQTEALDGVIQTDAAINLGNSGGPLFDLDGNVIGMNVAMAYGAENVGFAIPIKDAISVYQSVKEHGRIVRPFLGVRYIILNEAIAKTNNLPVDYGVLILGGGSRGELAVIPGSPANKAGLVENDIILEFDKVKLTDENNLSKLIQKKNVGDEVELKILSKGEEKKVKVTLEENKEVASE
ncbi:MAG TPA: trypsin-like serine protease [Candidatus Moranbacteria bacterium]|nr:trypsin-like serine protease [Candidatus Moranbacteria bacterium]